MSHFDDIRNGLAVIGFFTVCGFFVFCVVMAKNGLEDKLEARKARRIKKEEVDAAISAALVHLGLKERN